MVLSLRGVRQAVVELHQVDLYWGPDAFLAESPSTTKSVVTIHDLAWEHHRSGMILECQGFIQNGSTL